MLLIKNITSDPNQKRVLVLPDGTSMSLTMYFMPLQQGWFITNLTYGDFILNGYRIVNSPNMLYQYLNIIPFGLACFSKDDREPSLIEDFSSGASELYLLTQEEVSLYEAFLRG